MNSLYHHLQETFSTTSHDRAIVEDTRSWSSSDFLAQVDALAWHFQHTLQIRPQQPIGVMLLNQTAFLLALFALRKIGAIVVPINTMMLPQDIAYVFQHAALQTVIVDEGLLPHIAAFPLRKVVVGQPSDESQYSFETLCQQAGEDFIPPTDDPDTLAFLIYTSGTTGHPKGVMLSERNVLENINGFREHIAFLPDDTILVALPFFHAYGLIVSLAGLLRGARLVLIPKFHPKSILEQLHAESVTILPVVPTLYSVLLELLARMPDPMTFPALRLSVSGGAALPAALHQAVQQVLGVPILEGYGLTEASPVLSVNSVTQGQKVGTVGTPLKNVTLKIDPATQEILAKGPNVMLGYYHDPAATQACIDAEGWLHTGDMGELDEAGFLRITGRIKELIIKAGENITPWPIEQVLYQHPAVREAAVIGVPHPKLGEDIAAYVSVKETQSTTPEALKAWCREQLPAGFLPSDITILDDLPKNATGKIQKKLLKPTTTPFKSWVTLFFSCRLKKRLEWFQEIH